MSLAKQKADIAKKIMENSRNSSRIESETGQKPAPKKKPPVKPYSVPKNDQPQFITDIPLKDFKNFKTPSIIDSHSQDKIQALIMQQLVINDNDDDDNKLMNFIDQDFPSKFESVSKQKNLLKPDAQEIYGDIQFQRIQFIAEESFNLRFFDQEDEYFYNQRFILGKLSDINFINALVLASSNKSIFNHLCCLDIKPEIEDEGNYYQDKGIYFFRFYKNKHQQYTVFVDDSLPVLILPPNEKSVPAFSRSSNQNEFWISMAEKAYAKLHGSYDCIERINLREAINDLTSLEPEIIQFMDPQYLNKENLLKILQVHKQNENIVGFMREIDIKGKGNLINKTLINRIYILKVVDVEKKCIQFINPWSGLEIETNINLDQFFQLFTTIIILHDYPDQFRGNKFEIQMDSSQGMPSSSSNAWINNYQYIMDLQEKQPSTISVILKQVRGHKEIRQYSVGFAIIVIDEKDTKVTTKINKNVKTMVQGEFEDINYANVTIQLEKGRYVIIPYCDVKGQKGVYLNMEVYYDCKKIKFYDPCTQILQACEEGALDLLSNRKIRNNMEKIIINSKIEQIKPHFLFIPCQSQFFLLENYGQLILLLKEYYQKKANVQIVQVNDPLLDNYQDNKMTQIFLGLEEKDDYVQPSQDFIDEVEEDLKGFYDFNDYGLKDIGLDALIETLMAEISINELQLSENGITEKGVVNLCYQLQASHHLELSSIDLSNNQIGKEGAESLKILLQRFKNLKFINLQGNVNIPKDLSDKIESICKNRRDLGAGK